MFQTQAHSHLLYEGGEEEQNEFFQSWTENLRRFFKRLGYDDFDTEDLLQETLMTVWKKKDQVDPYALGGWIITIARNKHLNFQKWPVAKRKKTIHHFSFDYTSDPHSETPDKVLIAEEVRAALLRIFDGLDGKNPEELSPHQRGLLALRLIIFEDMKTDQIAHIIGRSQRNVRHVVTGVLEQLSERLPTLLYGG